MIIELLAQHVNLRIATTQSARRLRASVDQQNCQHLEQAALVRQEVYRALSAAKNLKNYHMVFVKTAEQDRLRHQQALKLFYQCNKRLL